MAERWPIARDLMTPKPITLPHDAQVSSALGLMRSKKIHEIPVLRAGKLAGVVTFETIARRSNLPLSTKVEHLLVLPPVLTPTPPTSSSPSTFWPGGSGRRSSWASAARSRGSSRAPTWSARSRTFRSSPATGSRRS